MVGLGRPKNFIYLQRHELVVLNKCCILCFLTARQRHISPAPDVNSISGFDLAQVEITAQSWSLSEISWSSALWAFETIQFSDFPNPHAALWVWVLQVLIDAPGPGSLWAEVEKHLSRGLFVTGDDPTAEWNFKFCTVVLCWTQGSREWKEWPEFSSPTRRKCGQHRIPSDPGEKRDMYR